MWILLAPLLFGLAAVSLAAEKPSAPPAEMNVLSFNLRYAGDKDGENNWDHRRTLVFDLLREWKPDVIGMQEVLLRQLVDLRKALPEYETFGVGRSDGKTEGEHSTIMVRRDRFERLDGGDFWFSDTPEVPGSKHWGNRVVRICTWVRLKDRRTGQGFYVYNLHIDHESQPSREKSVQLLLKRIKERAHPDPVIVTGDFNAGEQNPAIREMLASASPKLTDSFRVIHPEEKQVGTFHGFREENPNSDKIDYIFVTGEFEVKDAHILRARRNGRYPSDHYPISAVLRFKG